MTESQAPEDRSDITGVQPYHLRCEHRERPLGIDASEPRFSWRLRSGRRGARPVAFLVRVEALEAPGDSRLVWDSGWVEQDASEVACAAALVSGTRYRWTVAVRDEQGAAATASSWFETGLLHRDEFRGQWITRDPRAVPPSAGMDPPSDDDIPTSMRHTAPPALFRTEVRVHQEVVSARLHVTARGVYTAWVNGVRAGDDELCPGWTDYHDRIQYQTYDVTDSLSGGTTAVGIECADGWWSGRIGFDTRRQALHYGDQPEVWAMLVMRHRDGSVTTTATGAGWTQGRGEIDYSDLLMGERQDARRGAPGWAEPGFDDSAWAPALVRAGSDLSRLTAQVDEPIRATMELPAKAAWRDPEDRVLIDFGQNLVGRARIRLPRLPSGTTIVFRYGEMLDGEVLYTANLRTAEARDVHVSSGAEGEVFEPRYTLHGFRYLEVSGLPPTVGMAREDATAVVLHNAIPFENSTTTSSADVNALLSNITWGQRGNFVGVPTDCPQRDERLGWMADAQVFLPTAAANASVAAFFTRWLRDVRHAQSPEGSFPDVVPVVGTTFGDGAPAWGDAGVIIPWDLYRIYGDRRLLAESFDSMRRWVDFVHRENPDLLWRRRTGNAYGDWLQIDARTPRDVLATAYFARSARIVSFAARALDRLAEAEEYGTLADRIRTAFVDAFVDGDGRIDGDTQTCYLLALAFELVPDELAARIPEHLVRTIDQHDGLLTTGFVGVSLLCPVLTGIGRADLAFALLETDRYPSWLYSVRHGATTIWERWDGWTEARGFQSVEMNSFNHYSLGSVGQWIMSDVAGIDQQPDSVAYRSLRMAPLVGGTLTSASGSYESPRGLIRSEWTVRDDRFDWLVEVPPGAVAELVAPSTGTTVDGLDPAQAEGVEVVEQTAAGTALRVASGRYAISGQAVRSARREPATARR